MNSRDSTPLVECAYTPPQTGLPDAVPGQRVAFESDGIALQMYQALPPGPPYTGVRPLLLVHSINGAASTYDVRPLFEYYRQSQPVFALDLPGFGISERGDCVYDPRMMTNAIHAAIQKNQAAAGSRICRPAGGFTLVRVCRPRSGGAARNYPQPCLDQPHRA
jgi:pimeloyl-ACP methyl ester carboxylesterase